jgi:hypothetical protein
VTTSTALPGERPIDGIDAVKWRARLPDGMWPAGFGESGPVVRADVFGLAERWRSGELPVTQLAVAALAWGHGDRGYGPYRTRRVVVQDPDGARFDSALAGLRADEVPADALTDAYQRLKTSKLVGLGPAFFTKILYFAGYRRGRGGVQPLILDRVVAGRLPAEAGPANRYTTGWAASTWSSYLRWTAEQARRPEYGGEPDLVEISLFTGSWTPRPEPTAGAES